MEVPSPRPPSLGWSWGQGVPYLKQKVKNMNLLYKIQLWNHICDHQVYPTLLYQKFNTPSQIGCMKKTRNLEIPWCWSPKWSRKTNSLLQATSFLLFLWKIGLFLFPNDKLIEEPGQCISKAFTPICLCGFDNTTLFCFKVEFWKLGVGCGREKGEKI